MCILRKQKNILLPNAAAHAHQPQDILADQSTRSLRTDGHPAAVGYHHAQIEHQASQQDRHPWQVTISPGESCKENQRNQ